MPALEKFLNDLQKSDGVTMARGVPEFVSRGHGIVYTPCMHDECEKLIVQALDAGEAERAQLAESGENAIDIVRATQRGKT